MEVKASLKYLHISPRKVRLVAKLIKKLSVEEAESQLKYSPKRSAQPVLKLLHSAIADAEANFHLEKSNLYIAGIRVDEGPALKRWRARARGAAYLIKKRSSHIFLILKEISPSQKKKTKEEKKKGIKKVEKAEKVEKVEKAIPKTIEKEEKKETKLTERKLGKNVTPSFKKKALPSSMRRPKIFQRKSF